MQLLYANEHCFVIYLDEDESSVCVINTESSNIKNSEGIDYIEQSQIYHKKGIPEQLNFINKSNNDISKFINQNFERISIIALEVDSNERHLIGTTSDDDMFLCSKYLDDINEMGFNCIGTFIYNTEFDKMIDSE